MNAVEAEAIRLTALIRAAEDWSKEYSKDPKSHAKLIKLEARWNIAIRKLFKEVANDSNKFVSWNAYAAHNIKADYSIDVVIDDDTLDTLVGDGFMRVSLDLVTEMVAIGAISGENIYGIKLGLTSTNAQIQKLATDKVASLVGKKVLPNGQIVDNPKSDYAITETVRNDIASSIKRSLQLGESVEDAQARMRDVIDNDYRAEVVTRTESVNAYQSGLREFADQSNAVGKEWQAVGSIDICATNESQGVIGIDDTFASGDSEPTAHPNCSCGIRYVYQQEWDDAGYGGE